MARITQDREDLLRDAKALVPRIMMKIVWEGITVEVFAGFRAGGALSLYFGAEPVVHFNNLGQLRRAYVDGQILKADTGKLFAWTPQRLTTATVMLRRELVDSEVQVFAELLSLKLEKLKSAINQGTLEIVGQFPADGDALQRLQQWLEQAPPFSIAASARVC